jgi:hypothetical protein
VTVTAEGFTYGLTTACTPQRISKLLVENLCGIEVECAAVDAGRWNSSKMSKAKLSFESSIKDAEDLLAHFDNMPKPPPPNAEVLKRAGLVMALTAWET